jgi:hypothetical protein
MIVTGQSLSRKLPWLVALTFLGRLAFALLALVGGVVAIGVIEQESWSWRGALQLLALVVTVGLVCLALTWRADPGRRKARLAAVAVVLTTVLIGAAGLEAFLRFRPGFIPRQVINQLPGDGDYLRRDIFVFDSPIQLGRRLQPGQDVWINGRATEIVTWNGRERFWQLDINSLPNNRVRFMTDENGFRNNPPLLAAYDVVVLGDSYTVGPEVQEPWPVLLAQRTNLNTLNLAMPGFSSQAEAAALRLYGLPRSPKLVILAYFEGNDLRDAAVYEWARAQGMSLPEYFRSETSWDRSLVVLTWARLSAVRLVRWLGIPGLAENNRPPAVPVYPLELTLNDRLLRLNFLDGYVAMLSTTHEEIVASQNYVLATTALLQARNAAENSGARFILLFVPSKAHVYLPLASAEQIERITTTGSRVALDESGFLVVRDDGRGPDAATFLAHVDDQALAIEEWAEANGIEFVNLTPRFQAEAAQGQELYLSLGTHWNEQGHQLAAGVVAGYLDEFPLTDD